MDEKKPVGRPRKDNTEIDVNMFGEYRSEIEYILKEKKAELDRINNAIVHANINLQAVQSTITTEKNNWERQKRKEIQDHNTSLNTQKNDITKKEYAINHGLEEHTKRMVELEAREKKVADLEDEKKKLSLSRIEVEKLTNQANESLKDARLKFESADDKLNKSAQLENEIKKERSRLSLLESNLTRREEIYSEQYKKLDKEMSNIEIVRNEITPRIEELKSKEQAVKEELFRVEQAKKELQDKIVEERSLLEKLDKEKSNLEVEKKTLAQKSEELKRNYLIGAK